MDEKVEGLKDKILEVLDYFKKDLINRREWGTITFSEAEKDLDRAKNILSYLEVLPIDYLPEKALDQIIAQVNQLKTSIQNIDEFTIETNNPTGERDNRKNDLKNKVDSFYTQTAQWIPFLAYQKGDVTENINKLSESVQKANKIIDEAKNSVDQRKVEIEDIVKTAKEAAASAGAAVFTEDFSNESINNEEYAKKWLTASIVSAVLTIIVVIIMWCLSYKFEVKDNLQGIQVITAKVVILSLFVTATIWCAKNYRILKHLSSFNNHRALSLRTLQAFVKAALEDQTRDAVLLEATRAVFTNGATGYLGGKDDSGGSQLTVVEMAKNIGKFEG